MEGSPEAESLATAGSVGLTSMSAMKTAAGTAWPLDRQLSAVEEVRTPSPRVETFISEARDHTEDDDPTPRGDAARLNGQDHIGDKPLSPRTNGAVSGLNSSGSSAWQMQKKKKKPRKTVKSENDVQALNFSGGEALPANESLRKGG